MTEVVWGHLAGFSVLVAVLAAGVAGSLDDESWSADLGAASSYGSLRGWVKAGCSVPVRHLNMHYIGTGGGGASSASPSDGSFSFDHVSSGTYFVAAYTPGYTNATRIVRVESGRTTEVNMCLFVAGGSPAPTSGTGTIHGWVRSGENCSQPLPSAQVVSMGGAYDWWSSYSSGASGGIIAPDGSYPFPRSDQRDLPPGLYFVAAYEPMHGYLTRTVRVGAGDNLEVNFCFREPPRPTLVVAVDPQTAILAPGQIITLTARVFDEAGNDLGITANYSWQPTAGARVVSAAGNSATYEAVANGGFRASVFVSTENGSGEGVADVAVGPPAPDPALGPLQGTILWVAVVGVVSAAVAVIAATMWVLRRRRKKRAAVSQPTQASPPVP